MEMYLTVRDCARLFDLSDSAIIRAIEKSQIPALKNERFMIPKSFMKLENPNEYAEMVTLLDSINRGVKSLVDYQAKRSGKRSGVKPVIRQTVIKRDGLKCRYCGKKVTKDTLILDHVYPVTLGGQSVETNLVVACIKCNKKKGHYTIDESNMSLIQLEEDFSPAAEGRGRKE